MFFETLINGLSSGGTYAMIALGYTMVYGIAKMLNFAHGDIIMVSAYVLFVMISLTGQPLIALIILIIFSMILGVVIEKLAYKPLRGSSPLAVLISAIGMSYLLQSLVQMIFGTAPKMVVIGDLGSITMFGVRIPVYILLTLVCTFLIMVLLSIYIKYSKVGRAMIAVSDNRDAAMLMGIDVNKIIALTFAIGSALAAVAGFFMMIKSPSLTNTLGAMPGIKAFTAAVIGGIGSIPGAMVGGILLGVIEAFSFRMPMIAPYTDAIEFLILIIILLVKPSGLLGKMKREKV